MNNGLAFNEANFPEILNSAKKIAMAEARPLVSVLESLSLLAPEAFIAVIGEMFAYPVLTMVDLQAQTPDFDAISYPECTQRGVMAVRDADNALFFVISDPFDSAQELWAAQYLNARFTVALAHEADITAYLRQLEERMHAMQAIVGESDVDGDGDHVEDISLIRINEDSSPVIKLVNSTIYDALKLQASDIHLECDSGCLVIKYRIDGVLVHAGQVNGLEMAEQTISRVKIMAELDISERRIPQDGRFKVRVNGREIDFRVSIMPNIFGEDAVLRLLDRQALTQSAQSLRLDNLGFDARTMKVIRDLARKPHGMLLATGPTGSGKTTTLYAALTEINSGQDKIITIEDPVEYRLPSVLQIPVNEKKGLTFARGLRSILRHDPDKIMVGEIRDNETAQIAIQAALTGHLVFTSVHANTVFDVLGRFLHMGVEPYSFAAALNGIIAQRLVRLNCPHCAITVMPDNETLHDAGLHAHDVKEWKFMVGQGCGHCRGSGYRGRRAVAEVLVMNDVLRDLIASQAPISSLREEALQNGMVSLHSSAMNCVAHGETTLEEVRRVAG